MKFLPFYEYNSFYDLLVFLEHNCPENINTFPRVPFSLGSRGACKNAFNIYD